MGMIVHTDVYLFTSEKHILRPQGAKESLNPGLTSGSHGKGVNK